MDEQISNARHAISAALQVLRNTPPDRMSAIYENVYGYKIENAHAAAHASVYEKMFQDAFEIIQRIQTQEQDRPIHIEDCGREDLA